MFKKKITFTIVLTVLIALVLPVLSQAGIWTCKDIPRICDFTDSIGCAGDAVDFNGCFLRCRTGSTVTPYMDCDPFWEV